MTYLLPQDHPNFITRLLMDLKKLYEGDVEGDVLMKVGKEPNETKEYQLHSFLMRVRSPYFNAALSNRWNATTIDNDGNKGIAKITLNEPDIRPKIFDTIFSYVYIGKIDLTDYDGFMLIELLEAADRLLMDDELVFYVQKYLRETKTDWIQENLSKFIRKIFLYEGRETFDTLRNYCITILLQNPKGFFDSEEFLNSNENILQQLLKRDDLDVEEIEIWNYLIKWGKHQFKKFIAENNDNDTVISDIISDNAENDNDIMINNHDHGNHDYVDKLDEWTDEDFYDFKNILCNLVPLIHFFKISPQDFYLYVYPYHRILPKMLFDDLLGSYLLPNYIPKQMKLLFPRKSPINSKIITLKHSIIIEQWIEKEDNVIDNFWNNNLNASSLSASVPTIANNNNHHNHHYQNRYNWSLLFQGSRDGFSGKVFHDKCNGEGPTIVVVKIRGTEELIGGYNPTSWHPSTIYKTFEKDSFIFSLGSHKIGKAIVSRLLPDSVGTRLFQKSSAGPIFGDHDLYISDMCNSNYLSEHRREHYTRRIREHGHFLVEDYEVFGISKKT